MNENDTIDSNLIAPLNEDNVDGSFPVSEPKQIYVDPSFYTSQNLNYFEKKVGVKNPRCKVVYIITKGDTGGGPQVGSYPWVRRNSGGISNENVKIFQAKVICPNSYNQVVPYPANFTSVNENELDLLKIKLHTTAFLEYDVTKQFVLPAINDEVTIEYVGNDTEEARILSVFTKKDVGVPQSNSTTPSKAFNGSDGSTLSDKNNNTTGDVKQTSINSQQPDGKCGDGKQYPYEDCKKEKFDSNGQIATLHPVFWGKINSLLNKIKQNENYTIKIGETIRSSSQQLGARKRRCPAALEKKGEEWLKSASWSEVLKNGPCVDSTPTGAVTGPYASNHLKGLAVDFVMDVKCPARNVNSASYQACRNTSKVFNLLNKYANEFGVINLVSEPWHWSSNGG